MRDISTLSSANINIEGEGIATLYIRKAVPHEPSWANLFSTYIDIQILGKSSSPGAVLVVRLPEAVFMITFGLGRHLINEYTIERDFGLKVALNSIGENTLRSIDKASHERTPLNTRTQASKEVDIVELAMNTDFDFLTSITGSTKVEIFGAQLSGRDALTLNVKTNLSTLFPILEKAFVYYSKKDYEKNFGWVDNLRRIKDEKLVGILDSLLIKELKTDPIVGNCWLAEPEIIDWESAAYYAYERNGKKTPHYQELNIEKLIDHLNISEKSNWDPKSLKIRSIDVKDDNFSPIKSWSAYSCLYAEIEHDEATYILQSGNWYKADTDFVDQIDKEIAKVQQYKPKLIDYEHDNEECYNAALSKRPGFTPMDKKLVYHGGGSSKIEFCDVIRNGTEFIHVKRGTDSSKLSHLFSQGEIAAEAFLSDAVFRTKLNKILPKGIQIANPKAKPKCSDYMIVFAIVSGKTGKLKLPFFSRIRLRNTVQRVSNLLGYKVAIKKIEITEAHKKTSNYK